FGSIAAFVVANRRLEVVVACAAGISAWQFLLPACIVGLLIGVFAATVYNPVATPMRDWSNEIAGQLTSSSKQVAKVQEDAGPMWLRQVADGRESSLGAVQTFNQGMSIAGVKAFVFDGDGHFLERIDAASGEYAAG